jgi:hypothetical protein
MGSSVEQRMWPEPNQRTTVALRTCWPGRARSAQEYMGGGGRSGERTRISRSWDWGTRGAGLTVAMTPAPAKMEESPVRKAS